MLIELHPGDIPGLSDNFDKLTLDINSQVTLHDHGKQIPVTLPQEASQTKETAYAQLGLPEYMNYSSQDPAPPTTETPTPSTEGGQVIQAETGDTVKVHYTGTLDDGTVFDTSLEQEPMEFTLGQGQLIPGFEEAVMGMQVGESKTLTIPAEQAYGSYDDELIFIIEREQLPEDLEPAVGQRLYAGRPDGQNVIVTVIEVAETSITVDANHRLAGKDLTFEIELIEIQ
ncbi:peptidylprolyl isomerase [Chloroflexota bacterium]